MPYALPDRAARELRNYPKPEAGSREVDAVADLRTTPANAINNLDLVDVFCDFSAHL
ncbi:hypothetical protein [Bradyrhizobium sp. JYMT SZCCT0428]|uniref:hypothetical protein n=1 Tax=Bradyrhizobium sp. JYMT SZCCT0428 TaxID=2807673 RepID=UPI001BAA1E29|nr:hypothetical protein [Bradyrhizobium sp. JYMT SZCCT0428]MBR1155296.1 hypothetical protein [Bradyrhizobium sp. JYMT SZCCT0428]